MGVHERGAGLSSLVDFVEVGSGAPARLLLVRCDIVQINWTGTGEHGRILATPISSIEGSTVHIDEDEEYAEEQDEVDDMLEAAELNSVSSLVETQEEDFADDFTKNDGR